MKTADNIAAFCAGYISALNTAGVEWSDWGIPLAIDCCSIDLVRGGNKVHVFAFHPSGRREEFVMVEKPNMYGDNEWVRE